MIADDAPAPHRAASDPAYSTSPSPQHQTMLNKLRAELGEDADMLAPMVGGGVVIHKVRAVTGDNCNGAVKNRRLIAEKSEDSRNATFSAEELAKLPEETRNVIATPGLNHARASIMAEYLRLSKVQLTATLHRFRRLWQRCRGGRSTQPYPQRPTASVVCRERACERERETCTAHCCWLQVFEVEDDGEGGDLEPEPAPAIAVPPVAGGGTSIEDPV